MLSKPAGFCLKSFHVICSVCFAYLITVSLFWNRDNIPLIVGAVLCSFVLLFCLWRMIHSQRVVAIAAHTLWRRLFAGGLFAVFFVVALLLGLQQLENFPKSDWDIWVIHEQAQQLAHSPRPEEMNYAVYFWRFPNNALLLALFTGWYRLWWVLLGSAVDFNLMAVILCVVALSASQMFVYGAVRLLGSNENALFCAAVWLFILPFYAYAATPYSDTFSLPLCTGLLWFLSHFHHSRKLGWLAGCGVLGALVFLMKGTAGVLLVALFLWLILFPLGSVRKKALALCSLALSFAAVYFGFHLLYGQSGFWGQQPYSKDLWQVPTTHWLMMAQNPSGPWVHDDYEETYALQKRGFDYDQRSAYCMDKWLDRIKNRGPITTAIFTNRKVVEVWRDGTYQVNQYNRDSLYYPNSPVVSFFCPGTPSYSAFWFVSNGLHFSLLICLAVGSFHRIRRKFAAVDLVFFAQLCVFGMFLLELVWEWRSRYLFTYIPFWILAAPYGLSCLSDLFSRLRLFITKQAVKSV